MHNATIHDTLDKIYQHQYNPDAGTPSYHKSTDYRIPAPTSITHKTHFFRFLKLTRHLQLYACVHNKIIYKENSLFGMFIYSIKCIVAFQI